MNRLTFLLTGTYSSLNKGDAAMQLTTTQQLKKRWPKSEVVISTPFPEIDKKAYPGAQLLKSSRRRLIYGSLQIIRAYMYRVSGSRLSFLVSNRELQTFCDADVIIDLSGDTITEDYGSHVTYSHLLPLLLGIAFNKPVFVCAQSIGPFKLTSTLSRWTLNQCTAITAREEITYKKLLGFGIDPAKLQLTADIAFLMKPIESKQAKKLLQDEGIKLSKKMTLGISTSDLVRKRFEKANPGLSYDGTMAQALDELAKKHNADVLFISHVVGPSQEKDDRNVANRIAERMSESAYVLTKNYRPDELKGIIALCDVFIGARMHSNIGALSSRIPTIAIGYSQKTRGIMKSLSMEEFAIDIESMNSDTLVNMFQSLVKTPSIKKTLTAGIKQTQRLSLHNIEIISNLLRQKL